jgi:hypothetical protein
MTCAGHSAVCLINGKVTPFEALAPTLNCRQTDIGFFENSTKFFRYRTVSFSLQEEEFLHTSLLMLVRFDWVNAILIVDKMMR